MKYTEILKLLEMIEKAKIPFEFTDDKDGIKERYGDYVPLYEKKLYPSYQIKIFGKNNEQLCDAIQGCYSYGNEEDLLEIMGGLTEEEHEQDSVLGYLTAEEVFKRFKYCYEHNTHIYVEE